jgi:hypothetical protein
MMNSYRSRKFSNFRNRYWIKKFKKCIIFSDLVKEWLGSWTNAADETLLLIMDNIQIFNFPNFYRKSVMTYKATDTSIQELNFIKFKYQYSRASYVNIRMYKGLNVNISYLSCIIFIQYYIILVFDILKSNISELFIKTCNVKFSFKVQIRNCAHERVSWH